MRADDEEAHMRRLAHARWRVTALQCLLGSHRLLRKTRPAWYQQESNYVNRLNAAQAEVARLSEL
jgi:hypothetical protein